MNQYEPKIFNVDDDHTAELLFNKSRNMVQVRDQYTPGVIPRDEEDKWTYGNERCRAAGIIPLSESGESVPNIIKESDMKSVIEDCHARQVFPTYHMKKIPPMDQWSQNGLNYCFVPGTLVRLSNGQQIPIEKVSVTDEVVSAEGNARAVVAVMRHKHEGQIGRLYVNGNSRIQATPEHPFLTQRGYVQLKDLDPAIDSVAIPRYVSGSNKFICTGSYISVRSIVSRERSVGVPGKEVATYTRCTMPDVVHLTKGFGRLIGLFLAEGHTTKTSAFWSFSADELDTLVKETVDLLKSELGVDARVRLVNKNKSTAQVAVYSTDCAKLMEQLCGHLAKNKRLHPDLAAGTLDFLEGVLTGWMDGDRNVDDYGVTISCTMAMNMYDIANALGYAPVISVHTKAGVRNDGVMRQESWKVGWSPRPKGVVEDGVTWQRVRRVEYEPYSGYVYNLSVEEDNSYIAEGIGVHNCWAWGITGCFMGSRAVEYGHENVESMAAVSLGWTVNWRNAGNYLGDAMEAVTTKGIAPMSYVPDQYSRSPGKYKDGWETAAHANTVKEWWDINCSDTMQCVLEMLTVLSTGRPLYIAHNWWSHALIICGLVYDPKSPFNVRVQHWNSHGDGLIELTGGRAIPDEAYGIRATSPPQLLQAG